MFFKNLLPPPESHKKNEARPASPTRGKRGRTGTLSGKTAANAVIKRPWVLIKSGGDNLRHWQSVFQGREPRANRGRARRCDRGRKRRWRPGGLYKPPPGPDGCNGYRPSGGRLGVVKKSHWRATAGKASRLERSGSQKTFLKKWGAN